MLQGTRIQPGGAFKHTDKPDFGVNVNGEPQRCLGERERRVDSRIICFGDREHVVSN